MHGDKTRNIYKMDKDKYEKLLNENISQKYKLADDDTCDDIENERNEIASKLGVSERLDQTAKKQSFITLKDHKENFHNKQSCRLINPTKNEVGKISKHILDRINSQIRTKTNLNQWRSTQTVLKWFTNLKDKKSLKFIVFDIVDFYPSISEELLNDALQWAKKFTTIPDIDIEAIMHARRTLLYDTENRPWIKRDSTSKAFDVAMGAHDGAETCELVGLFILDTLRSKLDVEDFGLYRDDGLAVTRNTSGTKCDRLRKQLIRIFQSIGLKITVETNLSSVNYLDINMNLTTGIHRPFRKPNDQPSYINSSSNHPRVIIDHMPSSIGKRISTLSSNN